MLIEAKHLKKHYHSGRVKAVEDVSFGLSKGKTLGLLGESGCGKSTLAKLLLKLVPSNGGEIIFKGDNISHLKEHKLKPFRKKAQMIFQEPLSSLDPRMKVSQILKEPLIIHGEKGKEILNKKVRELLNVVELSSVFLDRLPHQLSGGECQRIAIARAISLEPELIVCDEPVSSLDALVQAQILNLLLKLQKEKKVAYLFVSHDLKVVKHMSDEIMVMQNGQIVEHDPPQKITTSPDHPYTQQILNNSLRYFSR